MKWRSIRIADKLTKTQWLEKAKQLRAQYGDDVQRVLDVPQEDESESRYSLHRLKSRGDYHVEGQLMENCINLDSSYNRAGDLHSLRDEDGLPVVSMRMRHRSNDDWGNPSDASEGATRDPWRHYTGNDVLVVDEAVQRGNAEITKYIRPALSAIVEYAKQNNLPKVVFKNGASQASHYSDRPVDVADIEKLINTQEETPDFLYVSSLKGLKKQDGSLPAKVKLVGTKSALQPIMVHEEPLGSTEMVLGNGEKIDASDFYESARVPFSKKRFERMGGLTDKAKALFSNGGQAAAASGWQIRPHVEELPRTVLNDVVKTSDKETKPFTGAISIKNHLGTANLQGDVSRYLAYSPEDDGSVQLRPELVHPNMIQVPVADYGRYQQPDGSWNYGTFHRIEHNAVILDDEVTKSSLQASPNTKKIYLATPSSLRDNPILFDREGINSRFTYTSSANLEPNRSDFTGTTKNDIWEIDTSKIPLDSLGSVNRNYNKNYTWTGLTGIIPYEALSLSAQSEMNKRKSLPEIIKHCRTCNTPWGDDNSAHDGHEAKLVNNHPEHSRKPEQLAVAMNRYVDSDSADALRRGEIPDSLKDKAIESFSQTGSGGYVAENYENYPHLIANYNNDDFFDATSSDVQWRRPERFAEYASGESLPTKRIYRLRPEKQVDLTLGGTIDIPEKPEKMYFGVDSQKRRDEDIYGEQGIDIRHFYHRNMQIHPTADHIASTQDMWSIDTSHPDIKDRVLYDLSSKKWIFGSPQNTNIPYGALKLEKRAEEALSPHVRQFFSKVAAYLNSRRVAQYLTDGESSGGWVSEYWGQGGSVSAPTTADPNEVAVDPETGKRKRPNGSLWTTIGDNGIDNPMFVRQLMDDPKFQNLVKGWQGLKNLFSPNTPGINTYSSVIRIVEAASRRQERLQQRQEAVDWVNENSVGGHWLPNTAETVHELPNGFTVKKLKTYGDLGFEGQMMNHCLKEDFLEECPECEGSGRCPNYCEDGWEDCGDCTDGRVDCDTCDGDGHITCDHCEGYGKVEDLVGQEQTCETCEGSGNAKCEAEDCKDGQVSCYNCGGSGQTECGSWNCEGGTCATCYGNSSGKDANEEFDPADLNRASGQPYSLRTADDIPVVTWWEEPDAGADYDEGSDFHLKSVFGRGDEKPKPEYQHMILQYVAENKLKDTPDDVPVDIAWGRGKQGTYSLSDIQNMSNLEKPDSLYFNHDHYPCTWNGEPTKPCTEQETFTKNIQHLSSEDAWDRFTNHKRHVESVKERNNQFEDPSNHFAVPDSPLYRVDVADLNPQHLIFVPSDRTWQINPRKMKDIPRNVFHRVDTKEEFAPAAYGDLGLKNANWKNAAIWNTEQIFEHPARCQRCLDKGYIPSSEVGVVEIQSTPNDTKKVTCPDCKGSGCSNEYNPNKQPCMDGQIWVHVCPDCLNKNAALWDPNKIVPSVDIPCPSCQNILDDETSRTKEDFYNKRCEHLDDNPTDNCLLDGKWVSCGYCDEGRRRCSQCSGDGGYECEECEDAWHECEECDGGTNECYKCDGTGGTLYHNDCPTCEGTGTVTNNGRIGN